MRILRLAFFVNGADTRVEASIERWTALAERCGLDVEVAVHDIRKKPRLARQFDVFCTPTTIVEFPPGRVMHYVGLGGELEAFLRACGWKRASEALGESARELIEGTAKLRDASLRILETSKTRAGRG